ncbi:MAG: LysM peptidoglycan-binding domain-containing protein, partial [Terracidiphilus sp.]
LKRWNHIYGNHVRRGARLRIYAGGAVDQPREKKSAREERPEPHYVAARASATLSHHVRPGETLYSIARQYQTTVSDLRQWNPFLADRALEAGDILSILR